VRLAHQRADGSILFAEVEHAVRGAAVAHLVV
jgi:hypothetical protein